jgi:hypothetical protein
MLYIISRLTLLGRGTIKHQPLTYMSYRLKGASQLLRFHQLIFPRQFGGTAGEQRVRRKYGLLKPKLLHKPAILLKRFGQWCKLREKNLNDLCVRLVFHCRKSPINATVFIAVIVVEENNTLFPVVSCSAYGSTESIEFDAKDEVDVASRREEGSHKTVPHWLDLAKREGQYWPRRKIKALSYWWKISMIKRRSRTSLLCLLYQIMVPSFRVNRVWCNC